jgi:molybdopterin molybdotransferase
MLELEDAWSRILDALPAPVHEQVRLADAHQRVLAENVAAATDLPPFDNSSMDGYAVRAAETASAGPASPVALRRISRVAAGETFAGTVGPGDCVRLFTGSPLPHGADAVVMQEDTRPDAAQPDTVLVLEPVSPGENVRRRGEDVSRGTTLAEAGEILTPGRMALLAATGVSEVRVGRRPVAGLLATGSELREAAGPADLAPGQIYESNRAALAALAARAGATTEVFPLVPDTFAATRAALETALARCDIVVTSGGVSVGESDFVKAAWEALGGRLEFWKVALKPGKPFAFGRRGGKFLFGLPGNPVSAFVTFVLLVRPALLRWQGARDPAPATQPGVLAEPLANPGERRHFMRVRVDNQGRVFSAGAQASHALRSLAAANGLVAVPPRTALAAGEAVTVMRWD